MKRRRGGCLRFILCILLAVIMLYFVAGDGKTLILKRIYPVKYQEYVEKWATEYSVDKYLVYAVIKVESNFDTNAVSNAGAKGLMQLMDNTAQECSDKGGMNYTIPEDMKVAEKNIRMGCFYLKMLMDKYKDSTLAVTAYNGGAGNVDEWLSNVELSDGEGGLGIIPYKETENYVKKVFKTYDAYNRIYKHND